MTDTDYRLLTAQLQELIDAEPQAVPLLSNASALLNMMLPRLNWAGFYLLRDEKTLVLGPFQGKVACIHIEVGKGVCGTAVQENRTQLVKNVHDFPGHIACDSASLSEIVVPIRDESGAVLGVLDLDSPEEARFTEEDRAGLEEFVQVLERGIVF